MSISSSPKAEPLVEKKILLDGLIIHSILHSVIERSQDECNKYSHLLGLVNLW
jgi:hypothetical protein